MNIKYYMLKARFIVWYGLLPVIFRIRTSFFQDNALCRGGAYNRHNEYPDSMAVELSDYATRAVNFGQ